MTNTISASLGLSVLAFLMIHYGFANSDNKLVVAQTKNYLSVGGDSDLALAYRPPVVVAP